MKQFNGSTLNSTKPFGIGSASVLGLRRPIASAIALMLDLLQHLPELLKAHAPRLHDLPLDVA